MLIASSVAHAQSADGAGSGGGSGSDGSASEPTPAPPPPDEQAAGSGSGSASEPAPAIEAPKHKKTKKKSDEDWGDSMQGDIVDDEQEPELASRGMRFRWLFQTRYTETYQPYNDTSHYDLSTADGYRVQRVFMRATAKPRSWLRSKLLIDFADIAHKTGAKALKLAYAEIKLHPRVIATVGLFKRTYSLTELTAISKFELADVGPIDDLIKDAELGGRDIGAMMRIDPLAKRRFLSIYFAAMSGAEFGDDARADGILTGRITTAPIKHLTFGIDGVYRRKGQQVPPGFIPTVGAGKAMSADVMYVGKRLAARGEWLWGDRTDENHRGDDLMGNGGARTFMGAWGIVGYKIPVDKLAVIPAARLEWLDADREHPIGRRLYISGAITVMDKADQVRMLLDVSRQQVQAGTIPIGQSLGLLDQSATIVNVQVQIKI